MRSRTAPATQPPLDCAGDREIRLKTWLLLLARAADEDLARHAFKCANDFCCSSRPRNGKSAGWRKRGANGGKKWLCDKCSAAHDAGQYCEFCAQLYLERTLEFSALDGKEWAQCEEFEVCNRWAHVECLAKAHKTIRAEVISDNFKYLCCGCRGKSGSKKRRGAWSDELRTSDTNSTRKTKRKCTRTLVV
eukprot:TRINITY_DN12740_c0_g2_i4.p1 TRINITY_DN12740_c0_g2~~TRINITY_DN12740_c0_g2_i4.p1  ORF type:complete len:191 (-),score=20.17 TRINITY_DN12740_c0_g2_i4:216-788(-)